MGRRELLDLRGETISLSEMSSSSQAQILTGWTPGIYAALIMFMREL
jgi:hypothetical protein